MKRTRSPFRRAAGCSLAVATCLACGNNALSVPGDGTAAASGSVSRGVDVTDEKHRGNAHLGPESVLRTWMGTMESGGRAATMHLRCPVHHASAEVGPAEYIPRSAY